MNLRSDSDRIMRAALAAALPDTAVRKALDGTDFGKGKVVLVAVGKAAWQMAKAAVEQLGSRISNGVVITKYGHSQGELANLKIFEAGHPVPDENSFRATEEAIAAVSGLGLDDTVLFLISGGGSALFEKPLISKESLDSLTKQLLACGADIVEMNTVRKRFSAVKGGRFAKLCEPAKVRAIVLSDIIGDPLDMIASGPAYPDSSTCEQAKAVIAKYGIVIDDEMAALLEQETPKYLYNVTTDITGSVRQLCSVAAGQALAMGYEPFVLTANLSCEARDAGTFLANIAQFHVNDGKDLAFIAGGETVVHLTGKGKGGRNQELALSAAAGIDGMDNACVFSLGSDGTDGPTDAAGGWTDGTTTAKLREQGVKIFDVLRNNDAYHALKAVDGLIITGPTGTNVNDVSVLLIRGKK
jgi:hydroxypyruvate reductase